MTVWLAMTGRHHITVCARRPLDELHVDTPEGPMMARPLVLTSPLQATPAEWVLVTTKAYDAAGIAPWLRHLATGSTPVAILQNGIEHRERFAPYLRPEQIVPVMVDAPAERNSPTHVRQRGPVRLVVQDDVRGREFVALFAGTPVEVSTTPDLKSALWRKLCLNSSGVIQALLQQPAGVLHDTQLGELLKAMVRECMAVGRAEGAVLDDDLPERILAGQRAAPPDAINSIQADRSAGRPLELDARNGVIVRLGRKHGIPTPCNEMAIALLAAMVR